MVDAVHVDRYKHRLQPAVEPLWQANVPVLEGLEGE
jgi:hypothetical protein